jgi:hypothetical protein
MTDTPRTFGQQFGRRSWAEPWKIKMVEPLTMSSGEDRDRALERSGLQHLPAQIARRLHRPADRQRHERDERPPVGGHDARRRGLRREPRTSIISNRRSRKSTATSTSSPRTRGAARSTSSRARPSKRAVRAGQHVLHHHAPASGDGGRHLRRCHRGRGARPAAIGATSRGTSTSPSSTRWSPRWAGGDRLHLARRDGEHGRRASRCRWPT